MKQIAVITGASSGMGKEFAKQLQDQRYRWQELWLIARRSEKLEEIKKEFPKRKIRCIAMDLSTEEAWKSYEELLQKEQVHITWLIQAAGFGKIGACREIDWQEQSGMVRLNCEALTALTQISLPYMKKGSRIVQTASASAFLPQPGFSVYAASKAYVLSYSRSLNQELKKDGISVTTVCPGPVETEFFERAEEFQKSPEYKKKFRASKEKVVSLALKDAWKRKEVSVYGMSIKAMRAAARFVPHRWILKGFR